MKRSVIRSKAKKKVQQQFDENELKVHHLTSILTPNIPHTFDMHREGGFRIFPEPLQERLRHDRRFAEKFYRKKRHMRGYPFEDDDDYYFTDEEDDEDQPPMTPELGILMSQVPKEQHHYVYDVYNYAVKMNHFPTDLKVFTENTLRIGVISPMIFGLRRQNDDIIGWAEKVSLLPSGWESKDVFQRDLTNVMITFVEIADTFVQCLLRTESLNLIKISYHIGEWYNFRKKRASHNMRKDFPLEKLRKDLDKMMLLRSVTLIYANNSSELVWHIAVFVCNQYFFYLANSEYKRHRFLDEIVEQNSLPEAKKLREMGNEFYKDQKYSEAIKKYGDALALSPYNHMVYSNRAMAYLKLRMTSEYTSDSGKAYKCAYSAMCDAFRCIKLDPLYYKGHDRYAMALVALGKPEEAKKALKAAILNLTRNDKLDEVKNLEKRLFLYAPEEQVKRDKLASGDGGSGARTKTSKTSKDTKPDKIDPLFVNGSFRKNLKEKMCKQPVDGFIQPLRETSTNTKTPNSKDSEPEQTLTKKADSRVSGRTSSADSASKQTGQLPTDSKQLPNKPNKKSKKSAASSTQRSEKDKGVPSESGDFAPSVNSIELRRNAQAKDDLLQSLKRGSEALLGDKHRFAISLYDKCFQLIQEFNASILDLSTSYVTILRYARGVAYISVGTNEDIVMGMKEFRHILEYQPSQTMKAITLYELGIACSRQHRYEEALENIDASLKICHNKKGLRDVYYWPGTQTFIQHTDVAVLMELLNTLRVVCEDPPLPDYVCSSELKSCKSYGHVNSHIYVDDPNFKGYVCMYCSEKCFLHYHRECFKKKHIKIQSSCITPDCEGFVCRYTEYGELDQRLQEEKCDKSLLKSSGKEKKTVLKMPLTNPDKIERRKQKKLRRKEVRSGIRNEVEVDDEENEGNLADKLLAGNEGEDKATVEVTSPQPDIRNSNFVIKHKKREEELELQQQAGRKQAKKVKNKQTMSLEEFCGPHEDTGSYSSGSYGLDTSHFLQLRDDVARFEMDNPDLPVVIQGVSVDQLRENVVDLYFGLLSSEGPMRVDSETMTGFIQYETAAKELIDISGGLGNFLLNTNRFAMVENLVCVKSDLRKAKEMVDSVRSVPHGVAVVPHDFKENVERANAYVPERVRFSGYEPSDIDHTKSYDAHKWKDVVDQWERTDDDNSSDVRERSASASISVSVSDSLSEIDFDVEKPTAAAVTVEKISPELMKAWKENLDKGLINSLNNLDSVNNKLPENSPTSAEAPSLHSMRSTQSCTSPISLDEKASTIAMTYDNICEYPVEDAPPIDENDQFARNTPSVDSLLGRSNAELENVRCSSNGSSSSKNSRIVTPPAFNDYTQPNPLLSSFNNLPSMFVPSLPAYGSSMFPQYIHPNPVAMSPSLTNLLPPQPIGTPASAYSISSAITSPPHPNRLPVAGYGEAHFNSSNLGSIGNTSLTRIQRDWRDVGPTTTSAPKSVSIQTEDMLMIDKQCNTEYEFMDDADKMYEECSMLRERNEDLSDKLIQLKQATNVDIQDLTRQLSDALQNEKAMRDKSDKIQTTCEKETRKWKEEKRVSTDELNSMRQMVADTRWKTEERESKIKQLEEKVNHLQRSCEEEVSERESMMRQYQARLDTLEQKVVNAELEVIDEREKYTLLRCNEAIDNTNKNIDQQRAHVERMAQSNQEVPPIMLKNAQLAVSRRQRLMGIRDEQMAIYESQRESIRSGTIPLSSLPKLSPPSIMEVLAVTSMPMPMPRPPMPLGMMGPRHLPPHMQMRPPFLPPQRMMMPEQITSPTALSPPHRAPLPGYPALGDSESKQPAQPPTPVKDQSSRRNAAEHQLIQDIQNVFPKLSSDDVRGYISKLRENRVSLTGLKLIDLERQIVDLILSDTGAQTTSQNERGGGQSHPQADTRSDECTICHERMSPNITRRLTCNHTFHKHCIRDWLSRQSTCPVCRTVQP